MVVNHPYKYLFHKSVLWLRRSIRYLWLVGLAGYLVVLAGHAVYKNYQAQQETTGLKKRLIEAGFERERLSALVVYYKTDSFKEKELRRTLLLKKPEEKVYALPESSTSRALEESLANASKANKKVSTAPIWQQWATYLWTGEKG